MTNSIRRYSSSRTALAAGVLVGAAILMIFAALWLAFVVPSLANAFKPATHATLGEQVERLVNWAYLYGVFLFIVVAATATCGLLAIWSRWVRPYALNLAGVALISITAFKWPLAVILILWALAVRILGFRARSRSLAGQEPSAARN